MARAPGIVQINQYRQRSTPSGPAQPKARAQEMPDPFGGMLGDFAEAGQAIGRILEEREEDDARTYSARAIAEATNRYAERAAEVESNATDGWRELTRASNAAFETIDQEYLDNAPTGRAREYVGQHLAMLRADMVGRVAERERDNRRQWRLDDSAATVGTWETVLLRDPTQWNRAHSTVTNTVGAYTDITANDRRDITTRYQQSLAGFAVAGMIQRDPQGVLNTIRGSAGAGDPNAIASLIGGTVTSTQRTPERNAAVGGAENSMHLTGEAVDMTVPERYQGMARADIEADVRRRLDEAGVSASEIIYEGDHIHVGWRGAQGGGERPAFDPNSPFAFLSAEQVVAAGDAAEREIERRQATSNAAIRERETLSRALWSSGEQAPNAPTVEEVRSARGDVAAAEYEAQMMTFNATSSMQDFTNQELMSRAVAGPVPEGTERERLERASQRAAAAAILEQRADPMAYIARRGNIDLTGMSEAIGQGNWRQIGQRLRSRQAIATEYGRRLGMPANPVTVAEARMFRDRLDNVRAQDRAAAFEEIRGALTDPAAYMNFARTVYPDAPGAQLGMMVAGRRASFDGAPNLTTEVASRRLIDGALALGSVRQQNTPQEQGADRSRSTFAMPSDADLRRGWLNEVGNAYRGMPQSDAAAFEAFRAAYAGTAIEAGDSSGEYNGRFAREAAIIASGGIVDRGGNQTLLPWGMSERDFDSSIARGWDRIRANNAGDLNGRPSSYFNYVAIGGGRYAVVTRQGAPARNSDGQPITLRIPGRG